MTDSAFDPLKSRRRKSSLSSTSLHVIPSTTNNINISPHNNNNNNTIVTTTTKMSFPYNRKHNVKPNQASNTITNSTNSHTTSPRPEPTIIKRRNSSFAAPNSPWFRRNSFLSQTMIQDEDCSVYESNYGGFYSSFSTPSSSSLEQKGVFNNNRGTPHFSNYAIISLRECQGFLFNQDLFATPYQQVRSKANAKRYSMSLQREKKALLRRGSRGHSTTPHDIRNHKNRRHTSYHPQRPQLLNIGEKVGNGTGKDEDGAIIDEDDTDEEMHDAQEVLENPNGNTISNQTRAGRNDRFEEDGGEGQEDENDSEMDEVDDDEEEEEEDDEEDDEEEEEDDYREMHAYGGDYNNRRYRVKVTDILLDEEDNDIFPAPDV